MGILNLTPDSFSDGGLYTDPGAAIRRAQEIEREGADILDIGAQSTRPGGQRISEEEEKKRLLPALEKILRKITIPVSVDTFYPSVAKESLARGAAIINDCSGGGDDAMFSVVSEYGAGIILMFPREARREGEHPVTTAKQFLQEAIEKTEKNGIPKTAVCIDPGIGFGVLAEESFTLLAATDAFLEWDVPVLIGASRKRFISAVSQKEYADPLRRMGGTIAAHCAAGWMGASILRVHDVEEAVQAARVIDRIRRERTEKISEK